MRFRLGQGQVHRGENRLKMTRIAPDRDIDLGREAVGQMFGCKVDDPDAQIVSVGKRWGDDLFGQGAKLADQALAVVRDQAEDRALEPRENTNATIGQTLKPRRIADGQAGAGDVDHQVLDRGLVDQGKLRVAHCQAFPERKTKDGGGGGHCKARLSPPHRSRPNPPIKGMGIGKERPKGVISGVLWILRKRGLQSFPTAPR